MCNKLCWIILILFTLLRKVLSEETNENMLGTFSIAKQLVEKYENEVNTSIALEKSDRSLLMTWSEDFQVKQINITTKFRLQMHRHKEHNFNKSHLNDRWIDCLDIYGKEVHKTALFYFQNESDCLRVANLADKDKKLAVAQVEKEIRKWRKGYKYLQNLCKTNHPGDVDNIESCLVEYMQKDNYDQTLERLILLKLEVMSDLFREMTKSVVRLDMCLKGTLSKYLEMVRSVMGLLIMCYQAGKHF